MYSLTHSPNHLFSVIRAFIHALMCPYAYSSSHPFTHSSTHSHILLHSVTVETEKEGTVFPSKWLLCPRATSAAGASWVNEKWREK